MVDRDPKGKPSLRPGNTSSSTNPRPGASATTNQPTNPKPKVEKAPLTPEQKERSAKRKRRLVYISIILLLAVTNVYFGLTGWNMTQQKEAAEARAVEAEKLRDKAIADFQQAMASVDQYKLDIAGKDELLTSTEDKLNAALARIEELLSRPGVSASDLAEARAVLASMTKEKDKYFSQVDSLTQLTASLMSENKILGELLVTEKNKYSLLQFEHEKLILKLSKGAVLIPRSITFEATRLKSNGEESSTKKAKKAHQLSIHFGLDTNPLTDVGENVFHIRVEGPGGIIYNKVNSSGKFKDVLRGKESKYTMALSVDYQNKKLSPKCYINLPQGVPFKAGTYKLHIYHLGYQVGLPQKIVLK